jgi:hypothetical protein
MFNWKNAGMIARLLTVMAHGVKKLLLQAVKTVSPLSPVCTLREISKNSAVQEAELRPLIDIGWIMRLKAMGTQVIHYLFSWTVVGITILILVT